MVNEKKLLEKKSRNSEEEKIKKNGWECSKTKVSRQMS